MWKLAAVHLHKLKELTASGHTSFCRLLWGVRGVILMVWSSALWYRVAIWWIGTIVWKEHISCSLRTKMRCSETFLPTYQTTTNVPASIYIIQEALTLKTEAVCSPDTLVPSYHITRCHNPEDHSRNLHGRGYMKCNTEKWHFLGGNVFMAPRRLVYRGRDSKATIFRSRHVVRKCKHNDRAMAQAVSRRLPTTAARVRARVRSGGQSGTGAGFLRVLRFPLSISIPPVAPQSPSSIIRGWYNRTNNGLCIKWTQSHPTSRN
jgi:hypothetical protein